MIITVDLIQKRAEQLKNVIKTLSEQKEKITADLNANLGALQDCNFWIAQLGIVIDEPQEEPDEEATSNGSGS